jgi:hypothetical protein
MFVAKSTARQAREARRAAAIAGNGNAPLVYNYSEAAAILGISKRSLERHFELGTGPEIIQLSARRFGITGPALRAWQRARTISSKTQAEGAAA